MIFIGEKDMYKSRKINYNYYIAMPNVNIIY